jgi:hypothetical protein
MSKKIDIADCDRLSNWLAPTDQNKAWLENEVRISGLPGHQPRKIIAEVMEAGIKTGRLALARGEA